MNNDSNLVRARHLESLATAAKNYTPTELAELTLSGGTSYTLPTASSNVKGGVKVGTGLSMDGDTLNCTVTSSGSIVLSTTPSTVEGAMWLVVD